MFMNKFRVTFLIISLISSHSSIGSTLPSKINWLPKAFSKKLESNDCKIPRVVEWEGNIKIKSKGIIVGQFAAPGQYDIAVMCNDKIFIHWGGPEKCPDELSNRGESLGIPDEEEIQRYLKRYNNKEWPSELTHDPLGMYLFGKSSFYQYCSKGKWLFSDGAD